MFIELHMGALESTIIHTMKKMGYSIIVTTAASQPGIYDIPILTKLVITQGNTWKLRWVNRYDITSVIPWSRFTLNKLVSDDRIDVITINTPNRDVIPSKAQAKVMAREGKTLEIVINPLLSIGEKGLVFLKDILMEYLHIDNLRIVVSQGINSIYDIRNPRDIIALLSVLTGMYEQRLKTLMSENPYETIVNSFYKKGICLGEAHDQDP